MTSDAQLYKFRLFVAGETPNSAMARSNLLKFCREHLPDRHEIEIVDVLRDPQRALADGIFMTPMLIRLSPLPALRIIGTLSDLETVRISMDLDATPHD